MAHDILARLGFDRDDNAATCQLIRHQIKMYLAAVRRDLEDPATIAEFTGAGEQTRESLRDLYLLTVVGVATISPSSLTNWKAGMLDALYHAADAELRGTDMARNPAQLTKLRQQLKSQWEDQNDARALDEFLDSMPERYVLTSSPAEIVGHARVAQRLAHRVISAGLVPSRHPDVTELCVVTETNGDPGLCVVSDDRPGLLASITAAITAAGLEIHSAQIHSRFLPNGCVQAVDLFWVRSARGADGVSELVPKIEVDLEQLISGRLAPRELLKRNTFEPSTKHTMTEVIVDRLASARHTVIEVLTDDRPGLLFTVAQAFHELGVSVAIAKIDTEGGRASDVFYVNEFDGTRLGSEARVREVRERILEDLTR
jgi:[protein-PII] uridylyltransferase